MDFSKHPLLLTPGPVNISAGVREAMTQQGAGHREPAFSELLLRLSSRLKTIFRARPEDSVLFLTGSGTNASESVIASCVPPDKKILILDNGAFGFRLAEIARLHGIKTVHLRYAYGELVSLEEVRKILAENPDIAVVAMVHHETSVGILNPVREVGELCHEKDLLFLVDAISSLGGEDLNVVRDHIDICWSTGCKCLHSIPGLSFICVSSRVWPRLTVIKPRVYSLDLKRFYQYFEERVQTPFTPAISSFFALDKACEEYLEEGIFVRQKVYALRNEKLRRGLRQLGLALFSETGHESHSLVTAELPEGWSFRDLDEALRNLGFIVYDCKPPLQGKYFQIGNMGELLDSDLDRLLEALQKLMGESHDEENSIHAKSSSF